jgi:hypothetical protein
VDNLNSSQVLVVVTATENRPELIAAQRQTLGRHFAIVFGTEATAKCVFCGFDAAKHKSAQQLFSSTSRFQDRSVGWYCAAQRQWQHVACAATEWKTGRYRWLVATDDDTFVHPRNLLRLLAQHNTDTPVILGSEVGGGAGFMLSRAAMDTLLAPTDVAEFTWNSQELVLARNLSMLDMCIHRHLGGNWCYQHADWFIKGCAEVVGISVSNNNKAVGLKQVCPVGWRHDPPKNDSAKWTQEEIAELRDNTVTCHYMDTTTVHSLYKLVMEDTGSG